MFDFGFAPFEVLLRVIYLEVDLDFQWFASETSWKFRISVFLWVLFRNDVHLALSYDDNPSYVPFLVLDTLLWTRTEIFSILQKFIYSWSPKFKSISADTKEH